MKNFNQYLEVVQEKKKSKLKCTKCGKKISVWEHNMLSGKCEDCKSDENAGAEKAQKVE